MFVDLASSDHGSGFQYIQYGRRAKLLNAAPLFSKPLRARVE
jgi:hypothetical protein